MKKTKIAVVACAAIMSMSSMSLTTEALGNQTLTSVASTAVTSVVELTSSFSSKTASFKSDYTSTTNAIRLNWNKVSGASGYRIYKYDSSAKKWVKVKTVKSGSTTTARITGLSAGSKYRFKVKAYKHYNGKTYWSKASSAKYAATKPKQVTMKASTATCNAIRLNWKKVKCDGYKIYQFNGVSYKLIATIEDSDITTYRVSLGIDQSGHRFTFKVRAYKSDSAGKILYGKCGVKTKTTKYSFDKNSAYYEYEKYLSENVKSGMSDYELLCMICEYPCSFDYSEMDCWGGSFAVVELANYFGFIGVTRAAHELDGSGTEAHMNALVYARGTFYICEVGSYGTAPRSYSVTKTTDTRIDLDTDFWDFYSKYL